MKYRVEFQMGTPINFTSQKTMLPDLPRVGTKVVLYPSTPGYVESITLTVGHNDKALYVITLEPIDTPPTAS